MYVCVCVCPSGAIHVSPCGPIRMEILFWNRLDLEDCMVAKMSQGGLGVTVSLATVVPFQVKPLPSTTIHLPCDPIWGDCGTGLLGQVQNLGRPTCIYCEDFCEHRRLMLQATPHVNREDS